VSAPARARGRGAALALALATALAPGAARGGEIERIDPRLDAIVPPGAALEKIADGFTWVEGPVWEPTQRALLFSDVVRNRIYRWREGASVEVFLEQSGYAGIQPFAGREPGSNGLLLDARGRLVLCQHGNRRIARLEPDGAQTVLAERYEGRRLNSPNDAVYDSRGALYFTDPPFGLPRAFDDPARELAWSGVYRLAPDGSLALLTRELRAPNGIALSPDEKVLYVSNAERERPVWMAYELRGDGTLGPGRVFADGSAWIGSLPGVPDGMEVDRRGNLFAAAPGGVHVFASDGARLGTLWTGVATSNVHVAPDASTLFVSASSALYRVRLAAAGSGAPGAAADAAAAAP
jgi:gluconolactonase